MCVPRRYACVVSPVVALDSSLRGRGGPSHRCAGAIIGDSQRGRTYVAFPGAATVVAGTLPSRAEIHRGYARDIAGSAGIAASRIGAEGLGWSTVWMTSRIRGRGMLEPREGVPHVALTLTWDGPRRLSVDHGDDGIAVVAHAELSHANVLDACAELEPDLGQAILNAWQSAVLGQR